MYIYIYIYIYICIHIYIHIYTYIYTCLFNIAKYKKMCFLFYFIYINIIYKYIYILYMVFTTEGFFEVAIESWPEWDLNPRPLNSVQTL